MVVKPEPIHVRIQENSDGLRIELVGRRRWWRQVLALVPVLWVLPFFFGLGVMAIATPVVAGISLWQGVWEAALGLIVFSIAFLGWCFLFLVWYLLTAWWGFEAKLLRTEVLTISRLHWQVAQDHGLWKKTRQYDASAISAVYLAEDRPKRPWWTNIIPSADPPGKLEFVCGRQTVPFASSATKAEACHLLTQIHRANPQLRLSPNAEVPLPLAEMPTRRWLLQHSPECLRLTLPTQRSWWKIGTLVYNLVFSGGWTGVFWILAPAVGPTPNRALPIMALLGALGAYLFIWSLRELVWHLRGTEVVELSFSGVRLQGIYFLVPRPHQYQGEYLTGLRARDDLTNFRASPGWWRRPGDAGRIAFNYGAATYRFGESLTPAEAEEVVNLILERFPHYGRAGLIGPMAEMSAP